MEPVVYLFAFFTWTRSIHGLTSSIESIPQASMEQCEVNGALLKGLFSEVKFKCLEGVITSGINQSVTQ